MKIRKPSWFDCMVNRRGVIVRLRYRVIGCVWVMPWGQKWRTWANRPYKETR